MCENHAAEKYEFVCHVPRRQIKHLLSKSEYKGVDTLKKWLAGVPRKCMTPGKAPRRAGPSCNAKKEGGEKEKRRTRVYYRH